MNLAQSFSWLQENAATFCTTAPVPEESRTRFCGRTFVNHTSLLCFDVGGLPPCDARAQPLYYKAVSRSPKGHLCKQLMVTYTLVSDPCTDAAKHLLWDGPWKCFSLETQY